MKGTDTVKVIMNRSFILIDQQDLQLFQERGFSVDYRGYAKSRTGIQLAKYILGAEDRKDLVVDHINGQKNDNRRCNIRICTQQENSMNRSRYKGTKLPKCIRKQASGKFQARICVNGQRITSTFDKMKDAMDWYKDHAKRLFGEYAKGAVSVPSPVISRTVHRDDLCEAIV